jgi:hypothetical protein
LKQKSGGSRRRRTEISFLPAYAVFFLSLLFCREDEGDVFLWNVGLSPNYTKLQPKRPYSS